MEENLRFKTDWASLIVGSEFTFFDLYKSPGGLYNFGGAI